MASGSAAGALRVIVAGGGVAALELVLALRAMAEERVEIELVAPETEYVYRPLVVAAPFDLGTMRRLSLGRFAAAEGIRTRRGIVERVDQEAHVVWLANGTAVAYDVLVLATGARAVEAVPGALTYRGEHDVDRLRDILNAAVEGRADRLAFIVPADASWPLPMYELALMASRWLKARDARTESFLITAEQEPLRLFGSEASAAVTEMLRRHGVGLRVGSIVQEVQDGRLWMPDEGSVRVDRAIALPRLTGRPPEGVPHDPLGFVEVDVLCRVVNADDVFAIGDLTAGRVKQGGLATQQADVAAGVIAARTGAPVTPQPYRPVLRGLLLTGEQPTYLRRPLDEDDGLSLGHEPLWWPPHKIAGRYLAPYLAGDLDLAAPPSAGHVEVRRPLSTLRLAAG